MALDTQAKRASAIHVSSAWRSIVPVPDGTIGQADRQVIAYYCGAVLFEAVEAPITGPFCVERINIYVPGIETSNIYRPGAQTQTVYLPGPESQTVCK